MLAFVFRAFFLIGVISWYSTSVWKMIDVYFKNRFESYLQSEYDKNPHMLADVEAYRASAAGKESLAASIPEEEKEKEEEEEEEDVHLDKTVEACSTDVSKEDDFQTREMILANKDEGFNDTIEAVKPEAEETIESPPSPLLPPPSRLRDSENENEMKKIEKSLEVGEVVLKNDSAKKGNVERKKTRRLIARGEIQEEKITTKKKKMKKMNQKKLKTITLTEKDFASTRIKVTPQDFAEFDLDEDMADGFQDEPFGVLVADLPFKPKLDLGDLRRVSPEEFCPMTLEDELSCDETTTWP